MDGLLAELSARQFAEWADYFAQDPWGEQRADLRSAIVAMTIANVHRGANQRAFVPADFMPYMERPAVTEAEIEARIERFMATYS